MAVYTTIDDPSTYFATTLYTGNSTSRTITTGMQSDLIWIKQRNTVRPNVIFDTVNTISFASGNSKYLVANTDAAITSNNSTQLTGVTSTGFTMGADNSDQINHTGSTTVVWTWKANGSGSANTSGTINTTKTSANTTSGFSIIQWDGNSTDAQSIGHGLGASPELAIIKRTSGTRDWTVGSKAIGWGNKLVLNGTAASASSDNFNSATPSSTVFYLGAEGDTNSSGQTYIGYFFTPIQGFSKFGTYKGNGNADGTFIYTGFKPAFFLQKKSSASGSYWSLWDNKRSESGSNPIGRRLFPNVGAVESEQDSSPMSDFCSNGIKMRQTDADYNGSGVTYFYMAFSEAPLVNSNGVPCNAR